MCSFRTAVAGNSNAEPVNRLNTLVIVVISTDNCCAIESFGSVLLLLY